VLAIDLAAKTIFSALAMVYGDAASSQIILDLEASNSFFSSISAALS
jgi:hypothetical protein